MEMKSGISKRRCLVLIVALSFLLVLSFASAITLANGEPGTAGGGDDDSGGGGGSGGAGGAGVTTNTTADDNETVDDGNDTVDGSAEGEVDVADGDGVVGGVVDFIKSIGRGSVALVLVSLGVISGVVWYFLVDKRKKFVEIKVKKKK